MLKAGTIPSELCSMVKICPMGKLVEVRLRSHRTCFVFPCSSLQSSESYQITSLLLVYSVTRLPAIPQEITATCQSSAVSPPLHDRKKGQEDVLHSVLALLDLHETVDKTNLHVLGKLGLEKGTRGDIYSSAFSIRLKGPVLFPPLQKSAG